MDNPTSYLLQEIQKYFKVEESLNSKKAQSFIRVHNHKLSEYGDLSISVNPIVWKKYVRNSLASSFTANNENTFEAFSSEFLDKAKTWKIPISRIELFPAPLERCSLFLNRVKVTSEIIRMALGSEKENDSKLYGRLSKNPTRRIHQLATRFDENNLTFYRAALIQRTLKNILSYSKWVVVDQNEAAKDVLQIRVLSVAGKSTEQEQNDALVKKITLNCGIVIDTKSGKQATVGTEEYIKQRTNDLNLMALHKYGIRAKDDQRFCELMNRLGVAAVTVDLIEKKFSSPSSTIRNGQGSNTKGACFILYNSARLETLLATFEERVLEGIYNPLPPIEDIDFTLLNNEEEWQLIFVYIFSFPDLIERCVSQIDSSQFAAHLIVQFLSGLVSTFSVYYRHIRILTEYRSHLMPQLYARIYLLKALRDVLNKVLGLLDIQPVLHM